MCMLVGGVEVTTGVVWPAAAARARVEVLEPPCAWPGLAGLGPGCPDRSDTQAQRSGGGGGQGAGRHL